MSRSDQGILHLAATAVVGLLVTGAASAAPSYRIEPLGKGHGIKPKTATAVNDNGQAVGVGNDTVTREKVIFISKPGQKTNFLEQSRAVPYPGEPDVNNSGTVIGRYRRNGVDYGGQWSSDGTLTDLGTLVGCSDPQGAYPKSINNAGDLAISVDCHIGGVRTLGGFFIHSGVATMLPGLGGEGSYGNALNGVGQITGSSAGPTGVQQAFIWKAGQAIQSLVPTGQESYGYAINDLGHVVGMKVNNLKWTPFLHDGVALRELPKCDGKDIWPDAITNDGLIVGHTYDVWTPRHTALIRNGTCTLLSSLLDGSGAGWTETIAYDVNEAGVIVGAGKYNGGRRAFIATPLSR